MTRQVIGIGASANDGTGDTLRDAFTKTNSNSKEVYSRAVGRPPKVQFFGDSLAAVLAGHHINSVTFWAQVRRPRFYQTNLSDGFNQGVPGASPTDINSAPKLAAAAAYDPDIIVLSTDMNNAAGTQLTGFAQIKSFINTVGPRRIIIIPTTPNTQAGNVSAMNQVALLRRLTMENDCISLFMGFHTLMVDPAGATPFAPVGAAAGAAGAYTHDGIHWSTFLARAAEPAWQNLLDTLGIPDMPIQPITANTGYSSPNQLYGSLANNGAQAGSTGATLFAPATGFTATSWGNNGGSMTNNTWSKDTLNYQGNLLPCTKVVCLAPAPLGANANVTYRQTATTTLVTGGPVYGQALVEIKDPVGISRIDMTINYVDGGVSKTFTMGGEYTSTVAANILGYTGTELLQFVTPGFIEVDGGTTPGIIFTIGFKSGYTGAAEIKFAQMGLFPMPLATP